MALPFGALSDSAKQITAELRAAMAAHRAEEQKLVAASKSIRNQLKTHSNGKGRHCKVHPLVAPQRQQHWRVVASIDKLRELP